MPTSFANSIALRATGADTFESLHPPGRMGNTANIAYGGCTLAIALAAAARTVPGNGGAAHTLYAASGAFLAPALTDRGYVCAVRRVRETRAFATRVVTVSQVLGPVGPAAGGGGGGGGKGGALRDVLLMTADFHAAEAASALEFSAAPERAYGGVAEQVGLEEEREGLVREGRASARTVQGHRVAFGLKDRYFEQRSCREGVMGQTLTGMIKRVKTSQDGLGIADKTSADWFRFREEEEGGQRSREEKLAAVGFMMDGALSFVPLVHDGKFLDDVGACASLDFALRVLVREVDLSQWHLRELKAIAGGEGRTYSEARLWDESGKMVAVMSQQSILRPKPAKKAVL